MTIIGYARVSTDGQSLTDAGARGDDPAADDRAAVARVHEAADAAKVVIFRCPTRPMFSSNQLCPWCAPIEKSLTVLTRRGIARGCPPHQRPRLRTVREKVAHQIGTLNVRTRLNSSMCVY